MHDIYSTLKKEHEEVKKILERIDATTDRAEKTRADLLLKLKEDLVPHMKGEEKVFYPALLDDKKSRKHVLEALEEHRVASTILRELGLTEKDSDKWHAKFSVLKENLLHHIEEEEEELFPAAHKVLNASEEEEILEGYLKEEERHKNSLIRRVEKKIREKV